LVIDGNKVGLASKETMGKTVPHMDLKLIKNIDTMFIPSAFIANWDWVGTGYEAGNILVNNGVATLIDPGGSLTFRARGGLKGNSFSNTVGEINTLRDPSISQGAEIVKGIDLTKSIKNFLKMPWSKIKSVLSKENDYITDVLKDLDNNLDKTWKKHYTEIVSKLEKRYKDLEQIIKKVM